MKLKELKNKKILILGFGREGKSTLNFLRKKFPKKNLPARPAGRPAGRQEIGVADQKQGENYLDTMRDYDVIIKSPGIPYLPEIQKAREGGKIITSSTEIFLKNCKGTVIGVTGTKGKSTTAALTYEILKSGGLNVYLIGNIGSPALDFLDKDAKKAIFVYELSSFQLSDLDISPHIAVITNIYPEHLDYHSNFNFYLGAKGNVTNFQSKKDYLIYNEDIPELRFIARSSKATKIPFSKKDLNKVKKILGNFASPLLGEFNLANIVPAVLVGQLFKVSDANILNAIINFKPLPHRLEFVAEAKGRRFYNDSLSTIPQATVAALEALGKRVETLITGGFDRRLDYSLLGEAIASSRIKNLVLFPDTGETIWKAVKKVVKSGLSIKKFEVKNMEEAVKTAFKVTKRYKIVLLSPASASFNLFEDYHDRGEQFKKIVLSYQNK